FHYENTLSGAVLHHPMVPRRGIELPDLTETKVLITAGTNDPMCTPEESEDLFTLLKAANADVAIHWENNGHQLTQTEMAAAKEWYQEKETKVLNKESKNDTKCNPKESENLLTLLKAANADVAIHWENNGHQLTQTEVAAAKEWYQEKFA